MEWSKQPPREPGYYWWRGDPEYNVKIVWVSTEGKAAEVFSSDTRSAAGMGGEWWGPLKSAK